MGIFEYKAPQAKVVELKGQGVLCGSLVTVGNSSTEQLNEEDLSETIW